MTRALRLGTRASLLATTQSQLVADAVSRATGAEVELVRITTHGDVATGSLASLGGTGVFATALREALLAGECDFVVHSLKDLPTAPAPGLVIGAIPTRAPANDVLCAAVPLAELPAGARVGTGSPRRAAQVRRARPDAEVIDIRGNIDTRLRKVAEGEYDAILLAAAGLTRIGRLAEARETFALDTWPTSAGQGALAIEVREGDLDAALGDGLRLIADADATATALLERDVLAELEAGCAAPVGISAHADADEVVVIAEVYRADGRRSVRGERRVPAAEAADDGPRRAHAAALVRELLAAGAGDLADLAGGRA
ncbi:hydroxymethylbilane synthase [Microbacterium sp. X-17]|uniref:hydroxymethylbilane synthase n=1 Tax=Microbacterium sp. X-17 TaxID=3144404 RepID=UPI0031F5576E